MVHALWKDHPDVLQCAYVAVDSFFLIIVVAMKVILTKPITITRFKGKPKIYQLSQSWQKFSHMLSYLFTFTSNLDDLASGKRERVLRKQRKKNQFSSQN